MDKSGDRIGPLSRRSLLTFLSVILPWPFARTAGAADDDDPLVALARPAIGLSPKAGTGNKSHFGGKPLVPKGFEWPKYADKPLDFLLEVDLSEVADFRTDLDLPKTGRLLFFYLTQDQKWGFDPADRGCSRVYWFEAAEADVTMAPPTGEPLPEFTLEISQKTIKPDPYSQHTDALGLSAERVAALFEKHYAPTFAQLGGFPFLVQDDTMELESEATAAGINVGNGFGSWLGKVDRRAIGEKWKLLLQLPSMDEYNVHWGDSGYLYFWIRRDDLARRDFSQAWLILQSY